MGKLKLSVVCSSLGFHYGGVETYVYNLVKALSGSIEMELIVGKKFGEQFKDFIEDCQIPVHAFPFLNRESRLAMPFRAQPIKNFMSPSDLEATMILPSLKGLKKVFENSDIIEVNYPTESLLFPLVRNAKKIIHFHGANPSFPYMLFKNIVNKDTDSFLACSRFVKEILERKLKLTDIRVMYNFIDENFFHPMEKSKIPPLSEKDSFNVGFVGRISILKGFDTLLKTAYSMRKEKVQFFVVGPREGFVDEKLFSIAKRMDNIRLLGTMSPKDLVPLYNSLDCLLLPSRSETLSYVLLEAMGCSTIPIAANVGGIPEVIDDGKNGFLVPPSAYMAFAQRLRMMMENTYDLKKIRKNARKKAVENFSISACRKKLLDFYNNL